MSVVDTAGFLVVYQPRHRVPDELAAVRECATIDCTNEGPLGIPRAVRGVYESDDAAREDARCRPCVEAITFWLDPVVAGGDPGALTEARRWVLGASVSELRQRHS
jgi:hypothetical protein